MDEVNNSFSHPFLAHLILVLSIYEFGPFPTPVPSYDGPSTLQTDNILHALKTMARRMHTAEGTLAYIKASWNGPDSTASDYPSTTMRSPSDIPLSSSSPSTFPPRDVTSLATDFERNVNMSERASDRELSSKLVQLSNRAVSPMAIALDGSQSAVDDPKGLLHEHGGSSLSAPPMPHSDLAPCPLCGSAVSYGLAVSKVTSAFQASPSSGSPLLVPPSPLVSAAFEPDMSAVEELRLLKARISDVVRVCNAIARGDLSHRITVPFQGVFMTQVRDVVNGMVDKLDQFAREVIRVSQEVGADGYVSSLPTRTSHDVSLLVPQ
jgi:osomolarity two-component system sensor histidine kinase NIK1